MSGWFVIAMMATAANAVEPPRGGTMQAPPPPPVVIAVPEASRSVQSDYMSITALDINVAAGRDTLWSGSLKVGNTGANYTETLREAVEGCADQASDPQAILRGFNNQRQFNLTVNRVSKRDTAESFNVRVQWTRPVSVCEGGGLRGVTLDQTIDLAPGQTVRVAGDAGLVVTITRRAR